MSLTALQDFTFYSKYSRKIKNENRKETYKEAVTRVKEMMYEKYAQFNIVDDIDWAYDFVYNKKVLGSQRILQFGGSPVLKHNARGYNCCASYVDRLRFFQETMYLLLCGCGTGFSVQKHHIDKLPNFSKSQQVNRELPKIDYSIDDSIEGWADSIGVLLDSYFNENNAVEVRFKFDKIRPKGSFLSSSSGTAPGPEPLSKALEKIRDILENKKRDGKLRPIDAYDIVMHESDAVLSGGVRRSSALCMFSPDDEEMYNAKIGNWFYKNPQRGRSNNSAVLLRNSTTFSSFQKLMESTKNCGEPGFIWTDHLDILFNPCVEACFWPQINNESGWQFCNLSSLNGKKIKDIELFIEFAKAGAIIGTLQAGFTSFPYLGTVSENITKREALLGVSITGVMENSEILLNAKNQRLAAVAIKEKNEEMANKIGINPAARLTNLKPEGTTSCFLGTCSGIHPHHAKRYFRTVQANTDEEIYQYFKSVNPEACERGYWSVGGTDDVIRFCIEVEKGAKLKNDLPAIDLLKAVKLTQSNWVEAGTIKERLAHPALKHNVSNTINVKPEEWDEVTKFIYNNREFYAGVSLLPVSGDKDYIQAPFCAIYTPKEMIEHYGDASMFCSGLIEDSISSFDNLWLACDAALGLCNGLNESKNKWIERLKKFAGKYFDGNIKKTTYLLKDIYNWKLWLDLSKSYKDVDYTKSSVSQQTNYETEVACAGGKCDLY